MIVTRSLHSSRIICLGSSVSSPEVEVAAALGTTAVYYAAFRINFPDDFGCTEACDGGCSIRRIYCYGNGPSGRQAGGAEGAVAVSQRKDGAIFELWFGGGASS